MTKTYRISGMTCGGCRKHVEKTLKNIPGVTDAAVNLEKGEAEIEMTAPIAFTTFEEALSKDDSGYRISEK